MNQNLQFPSFTFTISLPLSLNFNNFYNNNNNDRKTWLFRMLISAKLKLLTAACTGVQLTMG